MLNFYLYADTLDLIFLLVPVLLAVAYVTIAERKTMASMQRRLGPNLVGFYGLLQPFADALKLVLKENIVPTHSNFVLFFLGPMITLTFSLLAYGVVPYDVGISVLDFHLDILYILVVSSLSTYGILLAGWSANSKYAFLGSLRSTAQLISYELILSSAILLVILLTGSLNLTTITELQRNIWIIFPLAPVFFIFFIGSIAETNRAPFDLAEAESELVSGFMTEHAAVIFVFFFLAEYASIVLICILLSVLFLGGYVFDSLLIAMHYVYDFLNIYLYSTYLYHNSCDSKLIDNSLFLGIKTSIMIFIFILVRASFPRIRYDQLMSYCWTMLLPAVIGLIIVVPCILFGFEIIPSNLSTFALPIFFVKTNSSTVIRSFSCGTCLSMDKGKGKANDDYEHSDSASQKPFDKGKGKAKDSESEWDTVSSSDSASPSQKPLDKGKGKAKDSDVDNYKNKTDWTADELEELANSKQFQKNRSDSLVDRMERTDKYLKKHGKDVFAGDRDLIKERDFSELQNKSTTHPKEVLEKAFHNKYDYDLIMYYYQDQLAAIKAAAEKEFRRIADASTRGDIPQGTHGQEVFNLLNNYYLKIEELKRNMTNAFGNTLSDSAVETSEVSPTLTREELFGGRDIQQNAGYGFIAQTFFHMAQRFKQTAEQKLKKEAEQKAAESQAAQSDMPRPSTMAALNERPWPVSTDSGIAESSATGASRALGTSKKRFADQDYETSTSKIPRLDDSPKDSGSPKSSIDSGSPKSKGSSLIDELKDLDDDID